MEFSVMPVKLKEKQKNALDILTGVDILRVCWNLPILRARQWQWTRFMVSFLGLWCWRQNSLVLRMGDKCWDAACTWPHAHFFSLAASFSPSTNWLRTFHLHFMERIWYFLGSNCWAEVALLPARDFHMVSYCLEAHWWQKPLASRDCWSSCREGADTHHAKMTVESVYSWDGAWLEGGGEISWASIGLLEKMVEFELSLEDVLLVTIWRVWQIFFGRCSLEGSLVTPFCRWRARDHRLNQPSGGYTARSLWSPGLNPSLFYSNF